MRNDTKQKFFDTLDYYKKNKSKLTDEEKTKYLKVLYQLAPRYGINLRSELSLTEEDNFLNNLPNPLDNEEFLIKLLNERYTNCYFNIENINENNNISEFDNSTYQQDLISKIKEIIPDLPNIEDNTNYNKDHIGNNIFYESKPIFKISLNTKNTEETYLFINNYILECLKNNLNYDMYAFLNEPSNAHTFLYISQNELLPKINIINKILPSNLDNPPISEAIISSYSISHLGIIDDNGEMIDNYNTYFDEVSEVSYYRTLAKLIINIVRTEEDEESIKYFIYLKNVSFNQNNSPLNATYNNKSFQEIKDIVNRYIPDLSNTIKIYFEDESKTKELTNEFRKSMTYISNICQNKNMKEKTNIAINTKNYN